MLRCPQHVNDTLECVICLTRTSLKTIKTRHDDPWWNARALKWKEHSKIAKFAVTSSIKKRDEWKNVQELLSILKMLQNNENPTQKQLAKHRRHADEVVESFFHLFFVRSEIQDALSLSRLRWTSGWTKALPSSVRGASSKFL